MGLISTEVEIVLGVKNIKHYEKLGYAIPKQIDSNGRLSTPRGTSIMVKTKDLTIGSNVYVEVKCDCPDCDTQINSMWMWKIYLKHVREDGKTFCQKCTYNLFSGEKISKARLKNSISFYDWCLANLTKDIFTLLMSRWDFNKNQCSPNEINYKTNKRYWFKCVDHPEHKSELKNINSFVNSFEEYGHSNVLECKKCNSFAQWGIDNICEDFMEKYWNYEKNINIDPWEISYGSSRKKIWLKCQVKDYHDSYEITPKDFSNGNRCSYCGNFKIHPLDSLGKLLEDNGLLHLWSDMNKCNPYEYAPKSRQDVYWKCPDGEHKDYLRNIGNSNIYNFRCPECQYSKGEYEIDNVLVKNNLVKIPQDDYNKLINKDSYTYFIPQKTFEGLLGLKNGLLSYDFYIPKYNLLIEYQGEFHDGTVHNQTKKQLEKQVEHDKRKKEYAEQNNIKLLEIWYWDFDNIEEILERELSLKEVVNID